mmetsp:Transcript_18655/g.46574  ORF Transcript_18655/g.46574 Transcript_18655/m.46574 type:complete len:144 (+) Transcript_18655:245-676(+)|eukprot:CAMPEP_0178998718 /NCGR_PEP_ID=MMETSP0795-20121207/9660_1 /TAXON_ID=88552 /ORGANISM="Amoebophrya sp., Strain Ameob2" /LENGTH=143 /DNA_ID=CAMNT_0020691411 /DNA_START=228 /DNA_END=659 /DNA_ORIENTATION=-
MPADLLFVVGAGAVVVAEATTVIGFWFANWGKEQDALVHHFEPAVDTQVSDAASGFQRQLRLLERLGERQRRSLLPPSPSTSEGGDGTASEDATATASEDTETDGQEMTCGVGEQVQHQVSEAALGDACEKSSRRRAGGGATT